MKKIIPFTLSIPFIIFLFSMQVNLSSCTKAPLTTNDTTILHDTTIVHDTTTINDTIKTSLLTILTSYTWQIQEEYATINGQIYHYLRGGINNFPSPTNTNIGLIWESFTNNGNGTYFDGNSSYAMTWQFTSPDGSNMQTIINSPPTPSTQNWNIVSITDSAFIQTTYDSSLNLLVDAKLVPVPKPI